MNYGVPFGVRLPRPRILPTTRVLLEDVHESGSAENMVEQGPCRKRKGEEKHGKGKTGKKYHIQRREFRTVVYGCGTRGRIV